MELSAIVFTDKVNVALVGGDDDGTATVVDNTSPFPTSVLDTGTETVPDAGVAAFHAFSYIK